MNGRVLKRKLFETLYVEMKASVNLGSIMWTVEFRNGTA